MTPLGMPVEMGRVGGLNKITIGIKLTNDYNPRDFKGKVASLSSLSRLVE